MKQNERRKLVKTSLYRLFSIIKNFLEEYMIDTIGMTDIGNGRPSNQDAYLLRQKEKDGKLYLLAVVCDGMGGLKKGEIASRYIVEVLKQ